MKKIILIIAVFIFGMVAQVGAAPLAVYSNDFDGNITFSSGVAGGFSGVTGTESVQSLPGFSGYLLRNTATGNPATATTLTLTNLPSHDTIDINFLFAFIDSWDSDNGSVAPDYFYLNVDSATILQITAANASGTHTYGGTQLGAGHYGWSGSWIDRAFDMSGESLLTIAHSASTLTIDMFAGGAGWQGGGDESWGIDNLEVVVNTLPTGVPEPATLMILGLGLIGLAGVRKSMKR